MTQIKGKFKPGQSGNPAGKPKCEVTADIKTLQELSRGFVETKIAFAMQRTIEQLIEVYKDPESQSIDVAISSIMLKSAKGDYKALNFLFDRVIGKVADKIEMNLPEPFVIKSLSGETTTLGMKKAKEKKT
jgi:hypothetical protein